MCEQPKPPEKRSCRDRVEPRCTRPPPASTARPARRSDAAGSQKGIMQLGRCEDPVSSRPGRTTSTAEDNVPQAVGPRCRLSLTCQFGSPCGAKIITNTRGVRQRGVRVQPLKAAIHLDVHAVLVGALPDVRLGVLFLTPRNPASETAAHCGRLRHGLNLFAHTTHSNAPITPQQFDDRRMESSYHSQRSDVNQKLLLASTLGPHLITCGYLDRVISD